MFNRCLTRVLIAGVDLGILRGGGGFWVGILQGGCFRVQVRRNFHILTSQKKQTLGRGLNPLNPLDPPLDCINCIAMFHEDIDCIDCIDCIASV